MGAGGRYARDFLFAIPNRRGKFPAMSVDQLEQSVLKLTRQERRRFAQWFYDHEGDILDPNDEDEISVATRTEVLRRRDELAANPGLAVPVTDEWFDQLKRKLADARARQASAR